VDQIPTKMRAFMKRNLRAIFVIIAALTFSGLAFAQDNPRYGTWKLNLEKSKFDPGPPPKSQIRTYTAVGKGQKCAVEGIDAKGNRVAWEYTANFDGKFYAETGPGSPGEMMTIKEIDFHTSEFTGMKDGKVVNTGKAVVSSDGELLTVTTKGTDPSGHSYRNLAVFDKQ
jgi:hypothetical protein